MPNRPAIPAEVQREILIESGHRCAVCGEGCPLERAHIIPWHQSKEHKAQDLICLCASCHERADKENWGEKTLREYKQRPWVLRRFENASPANAPKMKLQLTLDLELPQFDEDARKWLRSALSAILEIAPQDVQITSVNEGSVKVIIKLPAQSAEALLSAYQRNDSELARYLNTLILKDVRRQVEDSEILERRSEMRWLTPKEQETFRKDFQDKEREIQRYIGVYLSGLVLVTGWIIGPQSRPLINMILGNEGYNIYALLLLVVLNVIFINFLIYKSLIVHEVTQFVSYLSKPESAFNYWESWRRSRQSVTKPVRSIYTISLALLPVFISVLIMFILGLYIFGDSQASAEKLNQLEPSKFVVSGEHLAAVFQKAKYSYWFVALLHLVPLYFFYHNVGPTNKRWAKINKLRGSESAFKELSAETLASDADRPDGMIRLYDKAKYRTKV